MAKSTSSSWLPALLLLCILQGRTSAQNYGDLRLLQGQTTASSFAAGRLEIFINSTWGSICSDNFNITDAHVACRQLGFVGAISANTSFHTPFGRGLDGPIWLDEVSCTDASLMHILSCPNRGIGTHDCDHFSDVAVVCIDEPRLSVPQPMDVRLGEGSFQSEGRVEVYCNGEWEVVCNQESFQKPEADTVCQQLGFTEASGFSTGTSVRSSDLQLPIWHGQLECPANESSRSISACGECANSTDSVPPTDCAPVNVQCAHTVPYGTLRLIPGTEINSADIVEGRLEIFRNGLWGTVCSDTFDMLAANISCQQLGYVRALGFSNSSDAGFGPGDGPVLLTGFECGKDAPTLVECSTTHLEECDHSLDVAVSCTNFIPMFPPNTTVIPTDGGPKISTSTFIAIMVGTGLLLIICCICCAVCSVHFYLVPYGTKKENHGLYFIERESVEGENVEEAETSLDQKIAEMEAGIPSSEEILGKGLDNVDFVPNVAKPRKKNRYVPLDTTRGTLISQGEGSAPQTSPSQSPSSVPGPQGTPPVEAQLDGASGETQTPHHEHPLSRKVSVHSLNLPGTPRMPQSSVRRSIPPQDDPGSLESVLTAATTLSQASLSGTSGPVPTSVPIPPSLPSEQNKATVSLQRTSFGGDSSYTDRYQRASSADACESDLSLTNQWKEHDCVLSTDPIIQSSSNVYQPTPTKSIIKSSPAQPHNQSMPELDKDADSAGWTDSSYVTRAPAAQSSDSKNSHSHRVSFQLD